NCQFLTAADKLILNEEFEMSVSVKAPADVKNRLATFDLFCTRTRNGKEERTRMWAKQNGKIAKEEGESVEVQAKGSLVTPSDYVAGESVKFQLEACHDQASAPELSKLVEVSLKTQACWVGGDDFFFRTDGELPLLKEDGSLIQVLATAIDRVAKPPQKTPETVICFGYASSAGEANPNRKLSLRRAQVVKAILERDTGAWDGLAKANFETVDIQQFLSDLHKACGWECDPGAVDGQAGPKTKAAIESFQRECNSRYKLGLKEDGVAGPKTWGAVLRVIHGQVQSALGQDPSKEPSWAKPKWGHGGKGVYANGEDFASGGDKPEERSVQITFFSQGSEPKLVDKTDAAATKTDNPVHDETKVVRQKVAKGEGAPDSTPDPDPDNEVIYDAATDKLAVASGELRKLLDKMEGFQKKLAPYRAIRLTQKHPKDGRVLEGDELIAWIWAVNDVEAELTGKTSVDGIESVIKQLDSYMIARQKIGLEKLKTTRATDGVKAALEPGYKIKEGGIKEYLRINNRRAVWGFGAFIGKDARWQPRDEVLRRIREERAQEKQDAKEKKGPESELELKIFEKKLFEASGSLSSSVDDFFNKHAINLGSGSKNLDLTLAASAFRCSAEAAYGASINWKESKKVKIGAKAEASFALAQAAGAFTISIPEKGGVDLIRILRDVDPRLVKSSARALPILIEMQVKGNAFVGTTASASIEAGLDLKQGAPKASKPGEKPSSKSPEGGLEAGCDLFAGAKASAAVSLALKAKLLKDADIRAKKNPFEADWTSLCDISYGGWAAWGVGLTAGFKLGYFDKKWVFQGKIGVVIKGGCGTEVKGAMDVQAFMDFCFNLCDAIQWQSVGDIIHDSALAAFEAALFHCFVTGEQMKNGAIEVGKLKDEALRDLVHTASATMDELRRIDNMLDENIPGYSGFKKYQAPFLLLKGTHTVLKKHSLNLTKKEQAIYWVRNAQSKRTWMYATWKLKTNLIYEMSYGGSGWLGGFSQEDSEECIITVLKQSRSNWEFAKILQSLKGMGVNIDDCLDWAEQDQLDALKKQFHYG
ncbi:MAG: hypothetical protein RL173_2639, partial [Fibrobacterota bacterium]